LENKKEEKNEINNQLTDLENLKKNGELRQ